ncbi:UvrD-helicase domain-containing protein [Acetivibrio sp. MSJd-27]|uniref:UvrD-helicase domain-containing protein n=1 Tax=Acetivibrio sp. MSJd-27 TaxID=2841523 RepID=UPI001C11C286|nr:UvrD-helicase domain-containing protein [Acetivibrio sp. MSJd-27]MBU5449073.1 UvrD-helicase domain-containing protein [Acetivibrio sp. MSJd-27]
MLIADLHIHSKYSRATSKDCIPEHLDVWARRKGIDLVGTGDFTHPAWREELREKLQPAEEGLYCLKAPYRIGTDGKQPRFVISGEISFIYKKNGKVRKVHNLILLPGLEEAETLAVRLEAIGNIHSDGRPILGLDSRDLLEITLEACPNAIFIPAHIWTPHFSLFGAFSGFDTIEECFEDLTPHIHALETGLSSDPPMNWRLSALDGYRLVSNSDAHSPSKLGREATLLDCELSYTGLYQALNGSGKGYAGTLEFFPEEGKYHLDGHRKCNLCLTPGETEENNGKCPVCGKKITVGVLHRVEQLADRREGFRPQSAGHFESIIPLPEIIASCFGVGAASKKVLAQYETMLEKLGSEFDILRRIPTEDIRQAAGPLIAEGILRMRLGKVVLEPGYDGEYGKIKLLNQDEINLLSGQISFAPETAGNSERKKRKGKAIGKTEFASALSPEPKSQPSQTEGLNDRQRLAVQSETSSIAVIAGPGTGKTKTLVSRIVFCIRERGVLPSEIIAVTFTNKAAEEMRKRLNQTLGKETADEITIGTFHSICLKFLAQHDKALPLIEPYCAQAVAGEVLQALSQKGSAQKLLDKISRMKNGLTDSVTEPLDKACSLYQQKLSQYGVMDYDDVLLHALRLTEEGEMPSCRYLLVDEFQDINELQYRLICAWGKQNIFLIGDPDQSVYGFRGSDTEFFKRFLEEHPQTQQICLLENYRSTPEILSCALPVIQKNPASGYERFLTARNNPGEPVRLVTSESDFSEAIYIAKEINRMVGGVDMLDSSRHSDNGHRYGFSDFAVLYRTHRQASVLEKCLKKEGIPYTVSGREDFLEEESVRGILSFFSHLLHPEDVLSLKVCLKTLMDGSEDMIQRFPIHVFREVQTAEECYQKLPLSFQEDRAVEKWHRLAIRYLPMLEQERTQKLIAGFAAELAIDENPSVVRLINMACFFEDPADFLLNLKLGRESDLIRSGTGFHSSDSVSLMTLHGAKGLEFPVVFLCGLKQPFLPLKTAKNTADTEEERRLFYVGMTRAQEKLILLTNGSPSRFLKEIPLHLLKEEKASQDAAGPQQLRFF